MQPARPQLAEALACVTSLSADTWRSIVGDVVDLRVERDEVCVGDLALPARRVPVTRSARSAWETMAARGVLPVGWVDDPRRRFAAELVTVSLASTPPVPVLFPATVAECVAIASLGAETLRALEARAHDFAAELGVLPRYVLWCVEAPRQGRATMRDGSAPCANVRREPSLWMIDSRGDARILCPLVSA